MSTMTKDDLQKFFKEKKKEMEEDTKSKLSQITMGTFKKRKFKNEKDKVLNATASQ